MARKIKLDFSPAPAAAPPAPSRKLHLDFHPRVYMRNKTNSYLWLRDEYKSGIFLTLDGGKVEMVKVDIVTEIIEPEVKADKKAGIKAKPAVTQDAYRVWEDRERTWDLEPHDYDFKKAVEKYHTSLLQRTAVAEREMRSILGLPQLEKGIENETLIGDKPPAPTQPQGPSKARRERTDPPQDKGYTLQELCAELKKDPTEARKALRHAKVEKPGGSWAWPSAEAASGARAVISAI